MGYISETGRAKLPHYQYRGTDLSVFYKYVSGPACNWIVERIPRWVAPNLITFAGLVVMVVAHLVVLYYTPHLEGEVPSWVIVFHAVSGFVYQTLDNLDGKQARRTGQSSPLGLLFDHGVDSIVVTLGVNSVAAIFQTGQTFKTVMLWNASAFGFFMASWEEYYTGEFMLPAVNAPSEGIVFITLLQLMTAWTGVGFWTRDSLVPGVWNNTLLVSFTVLCSVFSCVDNLKAVYGSVHRKSHMGHTFASALRKVFPFFALNILVAMWINMSPQSMSLHPRLVIWTMGLAFSKLVLLLIVAHMCDEDYSPWRRSIVPMFFVAAHAAYGLARAGGGGGIHPAIDQKLLIEELFIVNVLAFAHMAWSLIRECCEILDINFLTVKHKKQK